MEVLITHGVDLLARDEALSRTALHIAAAMGHDAALQLLLRQSAPLDLADRDGATALILAAKIFNEAAVAMLAAAGADWSVADAGNMTALHHACAAGAADVASALLRHGCAPDLPELDSVTLTPLCLAVSKGAEGVARALLDAGADVDAVDCEQCNALLRAIHANNLPMLHMLVAAGADVSPLRKLGSDVRLPHLAAVVPVVMAAPRGSSQLLLAEPHTEWHPLVDAAWQHDEGTLQHLLQQHDFAGSPALSAAVEVAAQAHDALALQALLAAAGGKEAAGALLARALQGAANIAVVGALLQHGVLVQCKEACTGAPLHRLAEAGDAGAMQLLLEAGVADVGAVWGSNRGTALFCCSTAAAAQVLLAAGAAVDSPDDMGRTALMAASRPQVALALLEHGADVAATDADGANVLHAAAREGNCAKLQALLHHAPLATRRLLGAADVNGCIPLHAAVECVDCVHLLLDADPNAATSVDARDGAGRTPLLHAAAKGCHGAAHYLIAHGADVSVQDDSGCSAAGAAARSLDPRMLRLLLARGGRVEAAAAMEYLEGAIEAGDDAVGMLLVEHLKGAPPCAAVAAEGRMLLAKACLQQMPRLVKRMLACGWDPQAADEAGSTALHAVALDAASDRSVPRVFMWQRLAFCI
jgi:ankyrin repeat protein